MLPVERLAEEERVEDPEERETDEPDLEEELPLLEEELLLDEEELLLDEEVLLLDEEDELLLELEDREDELLDCEYVSTGVATRATARVESNANLKMFFMAIEFICVNISNIFGTET